MDASFNVSIVQQRNRGAGRQPFRKVHEKLMPTIYRNVGVPEPGTAGDIQHPTPDKEGRQICHQLSEVVLSLGFLVDAVILGSACRVVGAYFIFRR